MLNPEISTEFAVLLPRPESNLSKFTEEEETKNKLTIITHIFFHLHSKVICKNVNFFVFTNRQPRWRAESAFASPLQCHCKPHRHLCWNLRNEPTILP